MSSAGYYAGYNVGYNAGYNASYNVGFNAGYNVGYNAHNLFPYLLKLSRFVGFIKTTNNTWILPEVKVQGVT